ncbi:CHAT domain-containing protein [Gammaproteobacteria bacterium]|nr:CHAT domain-containing protein [Gammaproteobacteria bacterium]
MLRRTRQALLVFFLSIQLFGNESDLLFDDRYSLAMFSTKCSTTLMSQLELDRNNPQLFPAATILLASCQIFDENPVSFNTLNELGNHKNLISNIDHFENKEWFFNTLLLSSSNILSNLNNLDSSFQSKDYVLKHFDDWVDIAENLDLWESLILALNLTGNFNLYAGDITNALEYFDTAELLYHEKVDSESEYMGSPALMSSFLMIKLSKFQAQYFLGNIEALLSEARTINLLISAHSGPLNSDLFIHIQNALEIFWTQDSRLKEYEIFKRLEENILLALVRDPSIDFDGSFLENLAFFFMNRSLNGIDKSYCQNQNFYQLKDDRRLSSTIKNYLDFMCAPSSKKYNELITILDQKLKLPVHQEAFSSLLDCVSNIDFDCFDSFQDIDDDVLYGLIVLLADNGLIIEGGLSNEDLALERDIFAFYSHSIPALKNIDFEDMNQFVNRIRFAASGSQNSDEILNLLFSSNWEIPDRDRLNNFFQNSSNVEELLVFNNYLFQSYAFIFSFASQVTAEDLNDEMKIKYLNMLLKIRDYNVNLSLTIISFLDTNQFLNRVESDYVISYIKQLLHQSLEASYKYTVINTRFPDDHEANLTNILDILFFIDETPASQAIKLSYAEEKITDQENLNLVKKHKNLLIKNIQSSNLVITSSEIDSQGLEEISSFRNLLHADLDLSRANLNLAFTSNKKFTDQVFNFSGVEQAQAKLGKQEGIIYLFTIPGSPSIFTLTIYSDMIFSSYQLNFLQYESDYDPFLKLSETISDPFVEDKLTYINEFSSYFFRDTFTLFEQDWVKEYPQYENNSIHRHVSKYYFVQDGPFSSIPFHALRYKDKYIIENFEISYLPNLSSYFYLKPFQNLDKFIGFGNPSMQKNTQTSLKKRGVNSIDDLAPLEETVNEIDYISNKFKFSKKFFGNNATESNFKSPNMDYRNSLLYFATHSVPFGSLISDEPGLVLSASNNINFSDDGILTISEIAAQNFDNSIIGLSACKSFDAAYQGAKEYSGLAQAFFLGGANNVYSTMWDIESFSAVSFNQEVFNLMDMKSADLSKGIRLSSLQFINGKHGDQYKDPYFWAPYINIGL